MKMNDKHNIFYVECIGHDIRSTRFATGQHCDTLTANDYKDPCIVAYENKNAEVPVNFEGGVYTMMERQISMMVTKDKANTLTSTDYKGVQVICHEQI